MRDPVAGAPVAVAPIERLVVCLCGKRRRENATGVGLCTMEDLAWMKRCKDSRGAEPCGQCRPLVALEDHAGGVARVDRAGQQTEGVRRGSV